MVKIHSGKWWCGQMGVRGMTFLMVTVSFLLLTPPMAGASWMVDPARFHASVHGQISCQECHEDVSEQDLHPNPLNVGKSRKDFFQVDHCLACHDGVLDDLEEGSHGPIKIKDPGKYKDCLACHDAHYQARVQSEDKKGFDPARPVHGQCGECHESRATLPPVYPEDEGCMVCHQALIPDAPGETEKINRLCLHCHGNDGTEAQIITGTLVTPMDEPSHARATHGTIACTRCHEGAASYVHQDQKSVTCGRCHIRHDENTTGDVHMRVSCQSCHLKGVRAVRDVETNCIRIRDTRLPGETSFTHEMVRFDRETTCQRCHFAGNALGAAAMALPPKGILCMPCHTATFSAGDPITRAALVIFLLGLVLFFASLLTGTLTGTASRNPFVKLILLLKGALKALFSARIVVILKTLFWDVFLQRRLYRSSRTRWVFHALIFYAIIFRFFWCLIALWGSFLRPEWPVVWDMVNKNHPLTGVLFDVTGLMLLSGVVLSLIRGGMQASKRAAGLPRRDRVALGLIGGIVFIGFLLEGMRIALTGYPAGSPYSFVGYGLGLLFSAPRGLTEVYGFMWYIHAALTGAFIAYIPFSRLLHMIVAPVVLTMNALHGK